MAFDRNRSRGYSAIVVRWEYLEELDEAIASLKKAMVRIHRYQRDGADENVRLLSTKQLPASLPPEE